MFRGLINDAKSAVGSAIASYVARASVAIPFVVAVGFAIAATALMLVERFGAITAYWMMAGGFVALGVIAAIAVAIKEKAAETAEAQAEENDTAEVASDAVTQAAMQAPLALAGALFTTPGGAKSALAVIGLLRRNLPLVLLLVMIGALLWPSGGAETEAAAESSDDVLQARKPNGYADPGQHPAFQQEAA
jgi:uncharacterized membrane protein